jgi:hypothetical protein
MAPGGEELLYSPTEEDFPPGVPPEDTQVAVPTTGVTPRTRLPKTASPLPLIALIGLACFGAAGSIRLWRSATR